MQHFREATLKRIALTCLSMALLAKWSPQRLSAQDVPTLSLTANIVPLLATVRDRQGRIVKNLTADDFTLLEDGVPQHIRYFSHEADLPLTVGLLVDTSRSQRGVLRQEAQASNTFLNQVLREDQDHAFLVQFDTRVQTLQPLTSSRADLTAALRRLSVPDETATLIFSAVHDSVQNILLHQPGRKAMILLTDGVAYKDKVSLADAIEFAQRADTILYAIRFSDPVTVKRPVRAMILESAKKKGESALERMAKETGGKSYEVTDTQSVTDIYTQIEDVLRSQYSIGYTPTRGAPDGKYHHLILTTKDKKLTVDTREGYFAK
jgi:VWFA-related protein